MFSHINIFFLSLSIFGGNSLQLSSFDIQDGRREGSAKRLGRKEMEGVVRDEEERIVHPEEWEGKRREFYCEGRMIGGGRRWR